jgi:hypothetical protein
MCDWLLERLALPGPDGDHLIIQLKAKCLVSNGTVQGHGIFIEARLVSLILFEKASPTQKMLV